jgi:cell division protein ZipA
LDTSTLRWILIVVGVLVLASIWLFFNPEKKRKPKASRRRQAATRREPTLEGAGEAGAEEESAEGAEEAVDDIGPGGQGELNIGEAVGATDAGGAPSAGAAPLPSDKIVSLFLLARDNHLITGAELLQAMVNTGMDFGEMNIFHRVHEGSERPVFSLANAAKPGHFERDEWNSFETNGVVLFLTLPGPMQALDAWDSMLATARRMAEILHAELLDDERNPFTRQREAQLREEMRDYDRHHPASG